MQETLLQVFVVVVGLLVCPKDDPRLQDWDEVLTVGLQKVAPVSEETLTESDKETRDDSNRNVEDQSLSGTAAREKVRMPDVDADVTQQLLEEENSRLSESKGEPALEASQQKGKPLLLYRSHDEPGSLQEEDTKPQASPGHTKTTEKKSSGRVAAQFEADYLRHVWNVFSIISTICFFWKYFGGNVRKNHQEPKAFPVSSIAAETPLPEVSVLHQFYVKCVQAPPERRCREEEFLEGFASDLLAAMRSVCDENGGMRVQDFHMMSVNEIIVPLAPPEPYGYQCLISNNEGGVPPPDVQVWGQIKLVEEAVVSNGCPCQASGADQDVVCLVHCEPNKVRRKVFDAREGPLCSKNTHFLSKSRVTRWFQSTLKQAWALISHKYDFDLSLCYIEAPGALAIRFRSGKKLSFRMNPVVRFNTEAHFFIAPWSSSDLDTFWTLSLTAYEDQLMHRLTERLPDNSCHSQTLEIALFLHRRHAAWYGSTALRDFHFKAVLMHLLLRKKPSEWGPGDAGHRLRDFLTFMEKSLQRKQLKNVLLGNSSITLMKLPAEITKTKPVNLLQPLVQHDCVYRSTVMSFQDMLRNAHMLIQDYVVQYSEEPTTS
ncbi:hypothetical protein OJAV_G00001730 [Oryzias javanicus]|uniref:Inositol 1,4,5-trisphosphate receptor-interacting protein n=1 Tax=Oryzias javanicus TaxID=123683 RepID=A0A3S2N774_ORYJA|nr:hypothetical protein OJAV_G00001730 [Oryzias javanicus]